MCEEISAIELIELINTIANTGNALPVKVRVINYAHKHGYIEGEVGDRPLRVTPKGCEKYGTLLLAMGGA